MARRSKTPEPQNMQKICCVSGVIVVESVGFRFIWCGATCSQHGLLIPVQQPDTSRNCHESASDDYHWNSSFVNTKLRFENPNRWNQTPFTCNIFVEKSINRHLQKINIAKNRATLHPIFLMPFENRKKSRRISPNLFTHLCGERANGNKTRSMNLQTKIFMLRVYHLDIFRNPK